MLAAQGLRVIRFDNRDVGPLGEDRGGRRTRSGQGHGGPDAGSEAGGALPSGRHGGRCGGPAGRPRHRAGAHRRRLAGRHGRPAGGGGLSGAGAVADLDHVDDRQPRAAAGQAGSDRGAQQSRARSAGGPRRLPGASSRAPASSARQVIRRTSQRARAQPGMPSSAATIRWASRASTLRRRPPPTVGRRSPASPRPPS